MNYHCCELFRDDMKDIRLKRYLLRNESRSFISLNFGSPPALFEKKKEWTVKYNGEERETNKSVFWKFVTCQHRDDIVEINGRSGIHPESFETEQIYGIDFLNDKIANMSWEVAQKILK